MAKTRIGGSFAPPLSDSALEAYKGLIQAQDESPVKDAMNSVLACCEAWWAEPESTGGGQRHPSGTGMVVHLDDDVAKRLWNSIPWKEELQMYGSLFEKIDPVSQKDLRNAAFHLLWHASELEMDREPITFDRL